ncbi:NAD(P)/FAD-dependent oxidoreductase [Oceaniglobus indicus]|uniref:NAD(P)/FAD-dependent oxidoreductase n=1 Tax=Oceaniglobus indicus TaxID=2047749 RepID=UPI000C18A17D|nr:NAD(P)-binding protein [Oceaniglobus indicus]
MDVAIIGAGLAGLAAARILADAGRPAVIFDKGRGLGGRLATRRRAPWAFDHGAPGVAPAGGDLAAYLIAATAAGAAKPIRDAPNTHRGLPGMSGLVKPLAVGLDIRRATEVARVIGRGGRLALLDACDEDLGTFDRLICAIPAPQAARVLAAVLDGTGVQRIEAARMDPCWTLMASWNGGPALARQTGGAPFASVLCQHHGDRPVWVAHAAPDWSRANLELDRDDARDVLTNALMAHLGTTRQPDIAMAHRWRYARTAVPMGRDFLAQAGGRVLIGGDWALGPQAGHAFTSGQAMGRALGG